MVDTFSKLNPDHKLFLALKDHNPQWWQNLIQDKNTYIEVRKGNYLDIYHNGGRVLELTYTNDFKGKIHFEYIPLKSETNYIPLVSQDGSLQLKDNELEIIDIDNFFPNSLKQIQKRISKFYPPSSEKAIQASFILNNSCFIDSEFQHNSGIRFDLICVDISRRKLFAVELKTIGDQRLYFNENSESNSKYNKIDEQLRQYREFITQYNQELMSHYGRVYQVKQNLDLLSYELAQLSSLSGFTFEPRPILLIGDCTQVWIEQNKERLNNALKDVVFGCFFLGSNTRTFIIPGKTKGNRFVFE